MLAKAKKEKLTSKKRPPKGFDSDDSDDYEDIKQLEDREYKIRKLPPVEEMNQEQIIDEVAQYTIEEMEIDYIVRLIKKEDIKSVDEISHTYMRAKHTFHLLMCRLGQMQTYEHIMDMYRSHVNLNELKDTVIKLLLRCAYSYECIERCQIIFKMQKRHKKLMKTLNLKESTTKKDIDKLSNSSKGSKPLTAKQKESKKAELEAKVAYFCLHASRLFCQITKFKEESLHVVHV